MWRRQPDTLLIPGHDLCMRLDDTGQPVYVGERRAAMNAWFGENLEPTVIDLCCGPAKPCATAPDATGRLSASFASLSTPLRDSTMPLDPASPRPVPSCRAPARLHQCGQSHPGAPRRRPRGAAGVSVDLARAFAKRLGVELELVVFESAGKSVEAVTAEQADIGFFAIDSAARRGHLLHRRLRADRRRLPGARGIAAARPGGSRPAGHAGHGGQGQRLRPVPDARTEAGRDRARADLAGGGRPLPGREDRGGGRRAGSSWSPTWGARRAAPAAGQLHGYPPGDGPGPRAAARRRPTSCAPSSRRRRPTASWPRL